MVGRRTNQKVKNFAILLNRSEKSRQNDKLIFESFKKGHISLDECWTQFLANNRHYPDDYIWDDDTKTRFIDWLSSLGWSIRLKVNN